MKNIQKNTETDNIPISLTEHWCAIKDACVDLHTHTPDTLDLMFTPLPPE